MLELFLIIFGPLAFIYCVKTDNYDTLPSYAKSGLRLMCLYMPIFTIITKLVFFPINYKINTKIQKLKNLEKIENEIQEIKKELPRNVSEYVTWNNVNINENTELEFLYTLNITPKYIDSDKLLDLQNKAKTSTLEEACNNEKVINLDIPLLYRYIFEDNTPLTVVRVDKESCKNILKN